MGNKKFIQTSSIEAMDREFVQGNVPEIEAEKCTGCSMCVAACQKLGPGVLEIRKGRVYVARPYDCLGDGICLLTCPTQAIIRMSRYDPTEKKS